MQRVTVVGTAVALAALVLVLMTVGCAASEQRGRLESQFVPGHCSKDGTRGLRSTFNEADAAPVTVSVVNQAEVPLHLFWVDYNGRETSQTALPAGSLTQQASYVGHVWRVRGTGSNAAWVYHETVVARGPGDAAVMTVLPCREAAEAQDVKPDHERVRRLAATIADDDAVAALRVVVGSEEVMVPSVDDVLKAVLAKGCDAAKYLSEEPSFGCHIVCPLPSLPSSSDSKGSDKSKDQVRHVAVFVNSLASGLRALSLPRDLTAAQAAVLIVTKLNRPLIPDFVNEPALFSQMGFLQHPHKKVDALHSDPKGLLLFEGGKWIWPGVRVNHTFEVPNAGAKNQTYVMRTVSLSPRIFEVLGFLEDGEAPYIIDRARPHLGTAQLAYKDADKGKATEEFRKSNYYFMSSEKDVVLQNIEHRVQMLTRLPISHAEQPQVLRYDPTGFYSAHHDYFDPADYQTSAEFRASLANGRNRMCTVFFYLNNVTRGGETGFPRAGGLPTPTDYRDCSKGIASKPQKGKVIVFYSMLPSGNLDPLSLHGGCTVYEGEKWSINVWLWNTEASYRSDSDFTWRTSALLDPVPPPTEPVVHDEL
eukprot:m.212952 g.212952  ORF g.212952 m.212952 type:complete len:591 (-) comp22145_c0_seq1:194-1966(-)